MLHGVALSRVSALPVTSHQPDREIAAGNAWYLDDQFRAQLGTRGRRQVIEHRWQLFDQMIVHWRERHGQRGLLTVLDAGCGDGINLLGLQQIAARRQLEMNLVGVDYNPVRLARARRVHPGAHLQRASLYQLPFTDGAVDVGLCNHVLEHVPELDRAMVELFRVLRPGGLLIVGVPNEGCLLARARNHVLQRSIARTTDHVNFFTADLLKHALHSAGFEVLRVERETFFFPCSYVNVCCNEFAIGHRLMKGLRTLLPSQAGGLIVACDRRLTAAGRR
jgi:ubiquinone/menaquinone biosynthesis C-methylase UbiE